MLDKTTQNLESNECLYIQDNLDTCEDAGNLYYIHSKNISKSQRNYLVELGLYVFGGQGYTYLCKVENLEQAQNQMPLRPEAV